MIDVFTAATPNGLKIPIALEEMHLEWQLHLVSFADNQQKTPAFLALNPNGKIPVIIDRRQPAAPVTLFESAAILLHLAQSTGQLLGETPQGRADTMAWLVLQVAGLGPSFGSAGWAMRAQDPGLAPAVDRFRAEALRHAQLLDDRLAGSQWLNGEAYSVADIAHFCWLRVGHYAGVDSNALPNVRQWLERIASRPAVVQAFARMNLTV